MLKQATISSLVRALAVTGVVAAPSAHAQATQTPSVTVSLNGIDTRTERGARIVLRRIESAASQVCGGPPSAPLDRQMTFRPCVEEVTQRSVAGLNNVQLRALLEKERAPRTRTLASAR